MRVDIAGAGTARERVRLEERGLRRAEAANRPGPKRGRNILDSVVTPLCCNSPRIVSLKREDRREAPESLPRTSLAS